MDGTNTVVPSLTIAILSSQSLVWFGLKNILESSATVPIVVQPHQWRTLDGVPTETRADVFILDLDTARDAIGTIKQIRESAPNSKIVLLCGFEDMDRTHEVFVHGVEGIILNVQPPAVMRAMVEALYAPALTHDQVDCNRVVAVDLETGPNQKVDSAMQPPAWPDALTERERQIIRLVGQGLSNKEIAYELSISDSTVRHHMTNIFDKVGVANRQRLLIHSRQFQPTFG